MTAEPVSIGARVVRAIVAIILVVIGASLTIGGVILMLDGGSLYYLITGLAVALAGLLIFRGDPRGVLLYGAMLAWTLAWSLWEVGWNGWQLVPRLVAPFVLGLVLLLPPIWRLLRRQPEQPRRKIARVSIGTALAALILGSCLHAAGAADPEQPVLRMGVQDHVPDKLSQPLASVTGSDWQAYGNNQGGSRFSPLTDINVTNVNRLEKIWEADMGTVGLGQAERS
jgi:quinoprotein glucose dehydrogenase